MQDEYYLDWRSQKDIDDPLKPRTHEELRRGASALLSLREVHQAIHSKVTKSGKAPGEDGILGVMLRAADKDGAVAEALLPLLQACFKTGIFRQLGRLLCVSRWQRLRTVRPLQRSTG